MQHIAIGCAGWSIPAQHRHLFGEGPSVLARYATRFDVVEVNSSFYRSHRRSTYERWAATVPARFRFSVKLPKTISHEMALRGAGPALDQFLYEVGGLGGKLARLLLQLPPSQVLELRAASTFLRMLRRRTDVPLACEPRHPSWFSARADALLQRHGVSRVTADPMIAAANDHPPRARRWPYWRLHGSPRVYYSPYGDDALASIAAEVARARNAPLRPWVIFDNTAHGYAVANAASLQRMLASPGQRGGPNR